MILIDLMKNFNALYSLIMKIYLKLIFISSLLFHKTALANQECFLFINGEKEGQEIVIDQLIRPILSSHIQPIKSVPPEGITSRQLESECKYELSMVYADESLKVSLDSKRTKTSISGYASSNKKFPDNIREAFLTILSTHFSNKSKKKICSENADLQLKICPKIPKTLLIHHYNPDQEFASSSKQAVTILAEELQNLIQNNSGFEFIAMAGSFREDELQKQGTSLLNQYEANLAIIFSLKGEIQPSKSSMWKALATINLSLNAFKEKEGKFILLSSLDIKPERIPVRTLKKSKSFREKHYGRAARKLTKKWSEKELKQYLEKLR